MTRQGRADTDVTFAQPQETNERQQTQYIIFGHDSVIMQVARTSVLVAPCRYKVSAYDTANQPTKDALREVDVEEVEVERSLHKNRSDSDGVDHVLREVSAIAHVRNSSLGSKRRSNNRASTAQ